LFRRDKTTQRLFTIQSRAKSNKNQSKNVKKESLHFYTVVVVFGAALFFGIRAFQPPVSVKKMGDVKAGMSQSQVKELLGPPTRVYPAANFSVNGKNYQTAGQWTYTLFLTFGFFNISFDTNASVAASNYEKF
jgi:hypothetical protein